MPSPIFFIYDNFVNICVIIQFIRTILTKGVWGDEWYYKS
jgi:hypothetical protein